MMWSNTLPCSVVLVGLLLRRSEAILPTAAVDVHPGDTSSEPYSLLASQASFGSYPKMQAKNNKAAVLQLAPSDNSLLCDNTTSSSSSNNVNGAILLVPRGECTFELKAKNAQSLGASGIVVYGTLASRYSLNTTNQTDYEYTTKDIVYPLKYSDYDCDKGRAEVPSSALSFDPLPYNSDQNDPVVSGDTESNLCMANSPNHLETCPSKSCLLTGETTEDGSKMEACCAWDLHVWLYADPTFDAGDVTIPAVYVTMEQGQQLLQTIAQSSNVQVVLYSRYRPTYNFSAITIWALGVFVAGLAAYLSASDYRNVANQISKAQEEGASIVPPSVTTVPRGSEDNAAAASGYSTTHQRSMPPAVHREVAMAPSGEMAPTAAHTTPAYNHAESSESLELSAGHAFGFIVMASSGLLILFFFKVYNFVKIMYAFGCSCAVTQVMAYPLVSRVGKKLKIPDRTAFHMRFAEIGNVTLYELISIIMGYGLGLAWLIVAFVQRHPESNTFFWVTQDIMGTCLCIMFLSIIKLNSMKVAVLLLVVAFFYDIFFVFVTPLIFKGESVMITVATSGGPPKADPLWCEKYPDDTNCQGGDPLPMLLTIPRIDDYQGGSSLLGLGDIVLPGLLLSFAARLDAAKHLVGLVGGGNGAVHAYSCPERKCCGGGYFWPVVVAYAIGLFMANAAVYLMKMGQPALLYLVPCCLGTVVYMGWRRNELNGLWHGPKVVKAADVIVYGESPDENGHSPVPCEDGGTPPTEVPSAAADAAADESEGELPLLSS